MNKYEIMYIVKATQDAEAVKKTAEAVKKLVEDSKGKISEFKELGEKKLAYSIKNEISGYYYVIEFEASKEVEAEVNRKVGLDENILRHLIVRLDEE